MSCLQIIKCLRVDFRSGGCSSRQATNPYHDATGKSQHTPFSAGDTALNPRLTPCLTRASESDGAQLCASRPPKGVCKGPAASLGVWDERVLLGMCGARMHACSVRYHGQGRRRCRSGRRRTAFLLADAPRAWHPRIPVRAEPGSSKLPSVPGASRASQGSGQGARRDREPRLPRRSATD